ncbi:MAG: RecX family transcriptional regulator [Spirochaetaceae bacterium]|jgi:regulatory protein|nr:RecX family transcriptional regulator [Spirochaetaceae bacterium]
MLVVSVKRGTDPDTARAALSDGREFSFSLFYLPLPCRGEVFFFSGRELSAGEEEALRFAALCFRVERAALRLTARAEQTCFGISRKLERRGYTPALVRVVVARLTEMGIINDERYARLWLESRLGRTVRGPLALLYGLRGRGIDRETARAALKSILDFEQESVLLKRYLEKNHAADKKDTALKRRLRSEGFSAPVIQAFWEDGL